MIKFNVPRRKYTKGKRQMFSLRLHKPLLKKLADIADREGWTKTDLISHALDQFAQHMDHQKP